MKVTPELLERQWNSIDYTGGGFLQVDTQHPLEWHIGYQSISQKTLILVSETEIESVKSSKSMAVSRRRREIDDRWTLSFELLKNDQQGVFTIFCCDIIENSRPATNELSAIRFAINRYKQWSKLLESQPEGLMEQHKRKGLLGELLFLEERILSSETALAAINGWVGPAGADQDFMYSDGWYEVKSIGASSTNVSISSLQQLDCEDFGELVVKRIDQVNDERTGAISLNDIVYRINDLIGDNTDALDLFRSKLNEYGYIDLQEYSLQKFLCSRTERFRVDGNFPRLTVGNVPIHVTSAHYELDVPSLFDWMQGK